MENHSTMQCILLKNNTELMHHHNLWDIIHKCLHYNFFFFFKQFQIDSKIAKYQINGPLSLPPPCWGDCF